MKPLIFSFFAGGGFLDLGFEAAGFDIGFANELQPTFIEAYKHSRQAMNRALPMYGVHESDVDELLISSTIGALMRDAARENRTVGFIGGPPCPDFSVGGKNAGRHGDNGRLAQTYVDLICDYKPDFFVFENVKGLVRTAKHRLFFDTLLRQLAAVGYDCQHRLLNALEYGVAQDRDRILLVGTYQRPCTINWGLGQSHYLPDVKSYPWPSVKGDALSTPPAVPTELTIADWFKRNNTTDHANAAHCFIPRSGLEKFKRVIEGDTSFKSYKRLHRWRYSPTAAYGHNEVHLHPTEHRRISVAEALAIQSMPAAYTFPPHLTLTDMFKIVGNGVPYLMANGIAASVADMLSR
jgi:DNA (cytosine-5)-methyltransferase 1